MPRIPALSPLSTQPGLSSLPRHNHPLQPRLPIIAARAGVENGDAKTRAGVTVRAAQTELLLCGNLPPFMQFLRSPQTNTRV